MVLPASGMAMAAMVNSSNMYKDSSASYPTIGMTLSSTGTAPPATVEGQL
jgi:hypothetical protein